MTMQTLKLDGIKAKERVAGLGLTPNEFDKCWKKRMQLLHMRNKRKENSNKDRRN